MTLKERLKDILGIAKPGGIDDIVIRAVKTGVAVFIASPVVRALLGGEVNLPGLKAAALAAGAGVVSVLLNAAIAAIAKWTNS